MLDKAGAAVAMPLQRLNLSADLYFPKIAAPLETAIRLMRLPKTAFPNISRKSTEGNVSLFLSFTVPLATTEM